MIKKIIGLLAIICLIAGFFIYRNYKKKHADNVKKTGFLYIRNGAKMPEVLDSLSHYLDDVSSFEALAQSKDLAQKLKPGRYALGEQASNSQIIQNLLLGEQAANNFRIGNFDNLFVMLGKVCKKTQTDSLQFTQGLNKIAQQKGLKDAEDLKPYFFADTYQFFWTVSPAEFFDRFEQQHKAFWTNSNKEKAQKLQLSETQVYTMASIVQKECGGKFDEQKKIAGLYLNRLRKNMRLQSDPTVIFAINKETNFRKIIRRVYYKDLYVKSPYNTYMNAGLPPSPICVVDKACLQSVLDAEINDYIFMCADPKRPGYHKFTASDAEHKANAKAYSAWMEQRKIK
jgi:UPF0755 protein